MKCREFKRNAVSTRAWELAATRDDRLLHHANECAACGTWLERQQNLSATLQTLQSQTATLEAAPHVEQALRVAFRRNQVNGVAAEEQRIAVRALRVSRWFEWGASIAIAAAIVIGVFLGVRLVQRSHYKSEGAQSVTAAAKPESVQQSAKVSEPRQAQQSVTAASHKRRLLPRKTSQVDADENLMEANAGYVPLMLCDALSCSTDSQVVRMEVPSDGPQPQLADVVVGYDGVVRAVRMVN